MLVIVPDVLFNFICVIMFFFFNVLILYCICVYSKFALFTVAQSPDTVGPDDWFSQDFLNILLLIRFTLSCCWCWLVQHKCIKEQTEMQAAIMARCKANRWGCYISKSNALIHSKPSAFSWRQRTVQSSVFSVVGEEWEGAKPRRPQPSAGSRRRNEWCSDKGQSKEGRPNRKTKKAECAGRCLPEQENVLIQIRCILRFVLFWFFCCCAMLGWKHSQTVQSLTALIYTSLKGHFNRVCVSYTADIRQSHPTSRSPKSNPSLLGSRPICLPKFVQICWDIEPTKRQKNKLTRQKRVSYLVEAINLHSTLLLQCNTSVTDLCGGNGYFH